MAFIEGSPETGNDGTACSLLGTILLLLSFIFSATPAMAEQETTPQVSFLDLGHKKISSSLAAPSRWFDRFFYNPRLDDNPRLSEESAGTSLRLRGSIIAEEGEDLRSAGKVKARLRLPSLERRFHLILSSEDETLPDESLEDSPIYQEPDRNDETSLALQYTQERSTEFNLTHRARLHINKNELNPQLLSRLRYSIPVAEESILTLAQSLFWVNEDGFGEETRLDYDHPPSSRTLLRTTVEGIFSEASNGYEWLTMVQWLQSFSNKRALAVGAYVTGETRPQNLVIDYGTFLKYRQRIAKKWIFFEVKPELNWHREDNFHPVGILTLSLEVLFED